MKTNLFTIKNWLELQVLFSSRAHEVVLFFDSLEQVPGVNEHGVVFLNDLGQADYVSFMNNFQ